MTTMTMTPRPLQTGDVVQLRSGGPEMTVLSESPPGVIEVGWFSKARAFEIEDLPLACLLLVRPVDDEPSR